MSTQPYTELKDNKNRASEESLSSERRNKILYITVFAFLVFTLEIFIRGPYTRLSEWIQERLTFDGKCAIGDVLVYFKYEGKTVIFLILFNVCNLYTSLSMIILDSFGIFITGTIKLIYLDPRPFWVNEALVPCTCATNYGSPSTTGLDIYLVCIVVYRGLINKSDKTWWKVLVWCFFLLPQAAAWTSRFIQNIHSLHQLTFGVFCGYIIQYVYFEIMEIDMEDSEQLKKLVNSSSMMLAIALSCLSWLFFNAIHFYFIHVSEGSHMIKVIQRYCSTDIPYFLFDNESYQKTAQAFTFIGSIAGIMLEYHILFGGDYERFSKYNMGEGRWNDTDEHKTALRVIVMYFTKVVVKLAKWGSKKHDSVFYLNLSKNIVANFCKGLFYFMFIKIVFRFLRTTNESSRVTVEDLKSNPELNEKLKKPADEETKKMIKS
jgi:hypothetical protein